MSGQSNSSHDTCGTQVRKSDDGTQLRQTVRMPHVFLCGETVAEQEKGVFFMPQTRFQRAMFALLTVIVTVHAYVFYSLYVVNGATLMDRQRHRGDQPAGRRDALRTDDAHLGDHPGGVLPGVPAGDDRRQPAVLQAREQVFRSSDDASGAL